MRSKHVLPILSAALAVLVASSGATPATAQSRPQRSPYPLVKLPHAAVNPSEFAWTIAMPDCIPPCPQLPRIMGFRVTFRSLHTNWQHEVFVNRGTFSVTASSIPFPTNGYYEWNVLIAVVEGGDMVVSYPADDPPRQFTITRPSRMRPPIAPPPRPDPIPVPRPTS